MKKMKALVYTSWSEEREITELTSKLNDFDVVAQEYYHREKTEFSYIIVTKNEEVEKALRFEFLGVGRSEIREVKMGEVTVFDLWTHPHTLHASLGEARTVFGLDFEIHYVEKDSQGRDKVIVY